jgi:hypothetical protein
VEVAVLYFRIGFLGHCVTLALGFGRDDDDDEPRPTGIRGGAGGLFERCIDEPLEYVEGEPWEEEDRRFGFR